MKYSHIFCSFVIIFMILGCSNAPSTQPMPKLTQGNIAFKNTVVSLTFDDGDADNYLVRSILAENNLHATFYVSSGLINSIGYMTEEQIRNLFQDGNEIGGHTLSHTKLSDVRGLDLKRAVCQDRLNLLSYGFNVTSFAYPYGYYDPQSKLAVKECGYNSARVVTDGPDTIPAQDAYALRAMPYIVNNSNFSKMTRYINQTETNGGGWTIFVFHHVCHDCDKFSVDPGTFSKFAAWLGGQEMNNGLIIKTVNEVVGGKMQAGVAP
jgi:peptidoglycan/xylan/chitin deacetylase (PgdA/CDA1 family)